MAKWTKDGLLKATNLLEAAALRQAIMPVCACGHSAIFQPHGLWWHFERRHWDDSLGAVRKRFWCTRCQSASRHKVTPQMVDLVSITEAAIVLPLPPDDVWKRVARRMR
ncbi:hypothetical protein [Novosphingobium humi]|uniref:hypothetical protein n=1 Tax=Novosphingobium humi TaxID=2282397 RepID=UPI0025B17964|nr:hypothetical protein [Novosphingobium humi]WJS98185.1 hypothetical protein NYQ05_13780 [Novosphingobium humi]